MCNRYYTRIAFHGCINSSLFFKNQFENLPVFLSWGGGPPTQNSVVFNLCFELTSYFPKETWGGTQAYVGKPIVPSAWYKLICTVERELWKTHPHLHFEIPGTPLSQAVGVGAQLLYVLTTKWALCVSADTWWGMGMK